MSETITARPLAEWHEDIGDVMWFKFPIEELPWIGSPLDIGQTVEVHTYKGDVARGVVGGWPGYHTHFIRLPHADRIVPADIKDIT